MNQNIYTKIEINQMHHLDTIVFIHIHYIHYRKISIMNSGNLIMYKYVKILKLNFIMIIFSLHNTCLESENKS